MSIKLYFGFIALGLCSALSAKCQTIYGGLLGGISSRNLTNGQGIAHFIENGNHLNTGGDFAVFAEIVTSDRLSFRPMIEYSSQGSKNGIFQSDNSTNGGTVTFARGASLDYLMLPVLAKLRWGLFGKRFKMFADAGPFVSLLLNARQTYIITNGTEATAGEQDVRAQLHPFNAGGEGHLGISFTGENGTLFLQGGVNYGLLNIQRSAFYGSNYTGAINLTIGYSFHLGMVNMGRAEHFQPYVAY